MSGPVNLFWSLVAVAGGVLAIGMSLVALLCIVAWLAAGVRRQP